MSAAKSAEGPRARSLLSSISMRFAFALFLVACGSSSPAGPGEGEVVAELAAKDLPMGISVEDGRAYVPVIAHDPLRVSILKAEGGASSEISLGAVDFADYAQNARIGLDPASTVAVGRGRAYFLGFYGVTVAPLDGTAGRTLYRPPTPGTTEDHSYDGYVGGFALDGDVAYVCYTETVDGRSLLGRYRADGTWEDLARSDGRERCDGASLAVDDQAVYWATSRTVYRWDKATRASSVVATGLNDAPMGLAVSGDSLLVLRDDLRRLDKRGNAPLDASQELVQLQPEDLAVLSIAVDETYGYTLSQGELRRIPLAGGPSELRAQRGVPGAFIGLASDAQRVYFVDVDADHGGNVTRMTLRAVGR
jgi:hypothetical protein